MVIHGFRAALTGAVLLIGSAAAMAQSATPAQEPSTVPPAAQEPTTLEKIGDAVRHTAREAGEYISWLIPYDLPQIQPNGDILIRRDKPAETTEATPPAAPSATSGGAIQL